MINQINSGVGTLGYLNIGRPILALVYEPVAKVIREGEVTISLHHLLHRNLQETAREDLVN